MSDEVKKAGLKEIMAFFGYTSPAQFRKDWIALDEKSKEDIAVGIANGTFTY